MNLRELYNKKDALKAEGIEAVKAGDKEKAKEIRAKINELENEIKAEIMFVEDENSRSLEAQAKVLMNAEAINGGTKIAHVLDQIGEVNKEINKVDTPEYFDAFVDTLRGKSTKAQNKLIAEINNHTTENTGILVPSTIVEGIWTKVDELYPLWRDTPKMRVNGKVTIQRNIGHDDTLGWIEESNETPMTKFEFDNFYLDGHEISLGIEVSFKLNSMSRNDFVGHIQNELAKKFGYQLSMAVYKGTGDLMGYGIRTRLLELNSGMTSRVFSTQLGSIDLGDITHMFAQMKSGLLNGSKIYANNMTIWGSLASMQDGLGRPLLFQSVRNGSVGTIYGIPVIEAGELDDGEILLANMSEGMRCNVNKDITIGHETDNRRRINAYFLHAIVDFDVFDKECFVLLSPEASSWRSFNVEVDSNDSVSSFKAETVNQHSTTKEQGVNDNLNDDQQVMETPETTKKNGKK